MSTVEEMVADIERARTALLELLESIGPERMAVPIGENRWSPTQYLEHLVLAEEATLWRMFKAVDDWRRRREVLRSPTPEDAIEEIVARTWREREHAPPLAVPRLGEPGSYWIERMKRNAAIVRELAARVRQDELDALSYPHPISGPFTLRQGFEFVRFHIDRHRGQIEEAEAGAHSAP